MYDYAENGLAPYGNPNSVLNRMTVFNMARALFPYDKPADVNDVLASAEKIESFLYPTTESK